MPDIELEGIDIGRDDSAVDAAFAEAFRRSGDTGTQEDVTPDEESAASEQPRDASGRFATATEEEEPQARDDLFQPTADPLDRDGDEEEQPAEDEEPDEVAQFLSKYGGDPNVALRAAVEQSRLLGRQGDELGQLRQEVQQLRTRLETPAEQPRQTIPITEEVVQAVDQAAIENPVAALARVRDFDTPDGALAKRVMDVWFATDPRAAAEFHTAAMLQQQEARLREELGAQLQPVAEAHAQTAEEQAYVRAWDIAANVAPDINEHAQGMRDLMAERPVLAKLVLEAATPEERAQAFLTAYEVVASKAKANSQLRDVAREQIEAQAREDKQRAKVVRKPSATGSQPGRRDEEPDEASQIKAAIMGARNTDILSGFTTE